LGPRPLPSQGSGLPGPGAPALRVLLPGVSNRRPGPSFSKAQDSRVRVPRRSGFPSPHSRIGSPFLERSGLPGPGVPAPLVSFPTFLNRTPDPSFPKAQDTRVRAPRRSGPPFPGSRLGSRALPFPRLRTPGSGRPRAPGPPSRGLDWEPGPFLPQGSGLPGPGAPALRATLPRVSTRTPGTSFPESQYSRVRAPQRSGSLFPGSAGIAMDSKVWIYDQSLISNS
jgi:hypothetical protein